MEKQNSGFGSIFGFLMTMIGFAVGVGSLWRFPYICGTNGGALFIITYVLVILLVGIPLLTAEMSMGYRSQQRAVGAYRALEKPGSKWHIHGWFCQRLHRAHLRMGGRLHLPHRQRLFHRHGRGADRRLL